MLVGQGEYRGIRYQITFEDNQYYRYYIFVPTDGIPREIIREILNSVKAVPEDILLHGGCTFSAMLSSQIPYEESTNHLCIGGHYHHYFDIRNQQFDIVVEGVKLSIMTIRETFGIK